MKLGTATVIQANARHLPLEDNTVDLICTSPPYFALRSYQDGCRSCDGTGRAKAPDSYRVKTCSGCAETTSRVKCHNGCGVPMKWTKPPATDEACPECNGTGTGHYDGQIGSEPTPAEFVDALLEVTAECMRVLKPSGSLWVNLGDKYAGVGGPNQSGEAVGDTARRQAATQNKLYEARTRNAGGVRSKSLFGIPWRYALRCIDDLGLILRAEVIWSKPNGLPESVTDRVRRSHEQWFHFSLNPRYYSAVDEIREAHECDRQRGSGPMFKGGTGRNDVTTNGDHRSPLGKLPGSVWTVPTEPLTVPDHLGVDHFAAFPTEFPKRIIAGWSPAGVCTACGEGRRPVSAADPFTAKAFTVEQQDSGRSWHGGDAATRSLGIAAGERNRTITGYACACPEATAPTTPGVVLDCFGGTGTTAMVAKALGRHGITVDMSADYCRLARWRTTDRNQLAKVLGIEKAEQQDDAQGSLFGGVA